MPTEPSARSGTGPVERVPPHSEEAERGVLGSILLDADRVLDLCIERQLRPESFYLPAHRAVYEIMLEMKRDGRPIDLLTVTERLRSLGLVERVGGPTALDRMVDATPTPAHAEYYIDIVRQKDLLRTMISRAREAERLCLQENQRAEDLLAQIEEAFFAIGEEQHGSMRSWDVLVKETMREMEAVISHQAPPAGIFTGFRNIDRVLNGLQPGNMVILAARPSMGKTSLAMNIVENVALGIAEQQQDAQPVGIFSLEMSAHDLVRRMLCSLARLSAHKLMAGFVSVTSADHRRLVNAADQLTKAPIYLDDTAGLDIKELRARARRMKKKYNVALIVIDYLQLLHAEDFVKQGRQVEVSAISGHIKAMAKELRIPVLVLSQLSRAPEMRDKLVEPKLADLRDSGSLEQDADVVMLLRRPCFYPDDEEAEDETLAVINIAKHRNGPTDDNVRLNFHQEFMRFEDRAHGVDEAAIRAVPVEEQPE